MIMLLCYYTVGGLFPNGRTGDFEGTGNLVFLLLVITVNIKVLLSSYEYGVINISLMVLSDLSAFIVIWLVAVADPTTHVGLRPKFFEFAEVWCVFFFCTFAFILWDAGSVYANTEIRKWMEIKRVEDNRIEKLDKEQGMNFAVDKKISDRPTRGFAFAQEPGNDRLVTDNIMDRMVGAFADQVTRTINNEMQGGVQIIRKVNDKVNEIQESEGLEQEEGAIGEMNSENKAIGQFLGGQ